MTFFSWLEKTKITVNKKLNRFQEMQLIKSEKEVVAMQDQKKEKKAKTS